MKGHGHNQVSLQFSDPGFCERSKQVSQRIGKVTFLSVFQLVDCGHQGPVIKVRGPRHVEGGSLPDAIFTNVILSKPITEGPSADGTNRELDLREVVEARLAKGKVLASLHHVPVLQEVLADETSRRVDEINEALQDVHSLDAFTKSSKEASGLMPGHPSLA
jgi:hypothetical protein